MGFYGLIVVYALTSLDNRIDTLEEQIFKVEERYLNQPDVIESATTNIGKTKIAERSKRLDKMKKIRGKTVFSALYSGILLIGSLLASILGLGFLGIPNQEWAFNLCSLSAMLFFFGIGMTLVMIYDLTQF